MKKVSLLEERIDEINKFSGIGHTSYPWPACLCETIFRGPNRHKNNANNVNPDLSKSWISHLQQVPTALVIEDE
jgi:hypothetical protein